jgi:hypothetical protein
MVVEESPAAPSPQASAEHKALTASNEAMRVEASPADTKPKSSSPSLEARPLTKEELLTEIDRLDMEIAQTELEVLHTRNVTAKNKEESMYLGRSIEERILESNREKAKTATITKWPRLQQQPPPPTQVRHWLLVVSLSSSSSSTACQ